MADENDIAAQFKDHVAATGKVVDALFETLAHYAITNNDNEEKKLTVFCNKCQKVQDVNDPSTMPDVLETIMRHDAQHLLSDILGNMNPN